MNDSQSFESEPLSLHRQTALPRLLLQATRALNQRLIKTLHERGHTQLRSAHSALLTHLDLEGTRLTVLAQRAGITKQAMAELLIDLEYKGYVERRSDPDDRRAKCIYFTSLGRQALQDALVIADDIEAEFRSVLGEQGMQRLRLMLLHTIEQAP